MTARPRSSKASPAIGDKRQAILRAALEVFAERGVNGVAVPEIAARAGVGTGTIYRYFDSKDVLVNELYRAEKQALGERLNRGIDPDMEPYALFVEFWQRLTAFAREQPHAYRFLELQDHLPYLDPASRALERQVLTPIYLRVRALQKRGVYRSDIRAEVLMALVWGAFVNLFKSERQGLVLLGAEDIAAARDACWRMCTAS